MPLVSRLGAASSRGFGEFAQQTAANYIEDVFSTYLYTGNAIARSISNGIDLSGKGGMTWIKWRSGGPGYGNHEIYDTNRGATKAIDSSLTNAETTRSGGLTSFNSDGFSLGTFAYENGDGSNLVSWTFRKQPKFFDVVTYTGDGSTDRTINHSLDSTPAMIFVKCTSEARNWIVYNRNLDGGSASAYQYILLLNSTSGEVFSPMWKRLPTSTEFYVTSEPEVNGNGKSYVAYLFAHNAGGFGADGSQNVISCGSFTVGAGGTAPFVNLGYEPQFLLTKLSDGTQAWLMNDNMRGMGAYNQLTYLQPNSSAAEATVAASYNISATGFTPSGFTAGVHIYLAIRRGPMRTPTSGTSVLNLSARTGTGATATISNLTSTPDILFAASRNGWSSPVFYDRLRGFGQSLITVSTSAEGSATDSVTAMGNTSISLGSDTTQGYVNYSGQTYVNWILSRAPGFFDVVCYTGTGSARTVNHNLGVAPEFMIVKSRSVADDWWVYNVSLGNTKYLLLNLAQEVRNDGGTLWNSTTPTASTFSVQTGATNTSSVTYVAYLFASCPGVSKVGSYTGTGATQTISCGFTGGARYVLIKRTDSTGNWWVWDTARGMVAGTDPRLPYNSTAAETNANWVYTTTGGFQIVTSDATVNASGGTYIYLAIA